MGHTLSRESKFTMGHTLGRERKFLKGHALGRERKFRKRLALRMGIERKFTKEAQSVYKGVHSRQRKENNRWVGDFPCSAHCAINGCGIFLVLLSVPWMGVGLSLFCPCSVPWMGFRIFLVLHSVPHGEVWDFPCSAQCAMEGCGIFLVLPSVPSIGWV